MDSCVYECVFIVLLGKEVADTLCVVMCNSAVSDNKDSYKRRHGLILLPWFEESDVWWSFVFF